MRIFTRLFLLLVTVGTLAGSASAQCLTPQGMTATPLNGGGNCFMFVQFAIPNSNVSIYNAGGYVAQATANGAGTVVVPYACGQGPITAVLSVNLSTGAFCNNVVISTPATLPVKYTSFTSTIQSQGVLLKWATSYEFNNAKFVVEKSTDGVNYTSVGEIAGAENSYEEKNYSFTDLGFRAGDVAYYRIKQLDLDNKFTYSKVVYVNNSKAGLGNIRLFPNPVRGNETIQVAGISAADLNKGNVRIYSVTGAPVAFDIAGSNAIQLDSRTPSGMYIIQILDKSYRILKN